MKTVVEECQFITTIGHALKNPHTGRWMDKNMDTMSNALCVCV